MPRQWPGPLSPSLDSLRSWASFSGSLPGVEAPVLTFTPVPYRVGVWADRAVIPRPWACECWPENSGVMGNQFLNESQCASTRRRGNGCRADHTVNIYTCTSSAPDAGSLWNYFPLFLSSPQASSCCCPNVKGWMGWTWMGVSESEPWERRELSNNLRQLEEYKRILPYDKCYHLVIRWTRLILLLSSLCIPLVLFKEKVFVLRKLKAEYYIADPQGLFSWKPCLGYLEKNPQ